MFKPQQPKGRREKQTPKGRFQPSRTSQTDSILVQPKKNSTHEATRRPPHKTEIKLGIDFWHAVEFSRIGRAPTLHRQAVHRGNRSNLPAEEPIA
jgi:hypothetical protein